MKQPSTNIIIAAAVALALAVAAGAWGGYRYGAQRGAASVPAAAHADAHGAGERRPLYWHDPMMPGQKFDKPGKSPFMDMQLVPVYADEGAGAQAGAVSISPSVQQNLGVRTAPVVSGALDAAINAVGNVAYNERELVELQARSSGYIESLYVRAALDPVRAGQPLAELYVPDWIAAQEEFLAARRMAGAEQNALLQGARQRMRLVGMSDEQIRVVESSGTVHPRLTLTAPRSGVLAELTAREGMTVQPGAPLFRINGLASVWINAEIPEAQAAQVRPGDAATVRAPALAGQVLHGKVGALLPEVNAGTRTVKARIELPNPGGRLLPGMFANIALAPAGQHEVLLVPSEAVIQTGRRSVVLLEREKGQFTQVEVQTGAETNGQTEIRSGLQAGQRVVVSGQFLIDSEASLKGSTLRMEEGARP